MSLTNPLGDLELRDPKAMRALAHPVRLAILDHLQRYGPATATQLSPEVDASPSVTSWHLRHLASFGLVHDSDAGEDRRERWWEATARGFRFTSPDDAGDVSGAAAYRALAGQMFLRYHDLPRRWFLEVEERLPVRWRKLSGLSNTRVVLSARELAALEEAIEALLAPYALRDAADAPRGSRGVRLMRYVMAEAEPARTDDAGSAQR